MEAIEKKLYQCAEYEMRIKELQKQVDEILSQHNSLLDALLKSPSLEDVKVQGGTVSDPVFAAVQKIIDVYGARIESIRAEIADLGYLIDSIMKMVNSAGLTETEREYIQYRYFEKLRVSQTAARMGYSEKQVWRLKKNVIKKLEDVR